VVKLILNFLIGILGFVFLGSAGALVRQRAMLNKMDPLTDTGASFGLVFLKYLTVSSGLIFFILIIIHLILKARFRR
jgi:hypothetical protein